MSKAVQWLGADDTDLEALRGIGLVFKPGMIQRLDGGIELPRTGVVVAVGDYIVRGDDGAYHVVGNAPLPTDSEGETECFP